MRRKSRGYGRAVLFCTAVGGALVLTEYLQGGGRPTTLETTPTPPAARAAPALPDRLHQSPGTAALHLLYGDALQRQGAPPARVLHEYRAVLRIRPTYVTAYLLIAAVLERQGQLEEAVAVCRAALRCPTGRASAHFALADALERQAQEEWRRAAQAAAKPRATADDALWARLAVHRLQASGNRPSHAQ